MFAFGQEEAPAKTEASKRKPHRRVSLAGRSLSSHRNDENMVPVLSSTPSARGHATRRASIVGKGAPIPGQQAFIQAAMPSANGACSGPTSPPRQGAGGGGGAAATQMFNQNFELKRRQQELESMVQGYEENNTQLHQQSSKAQADLDRANARADRASAEAEALRRDAKTASANAKSTSAEIAGLRRAAKTASTQIASLRRDVTTAQDEGARALEQARAETEAATARAETAELANIRAADELGRAKEEAAAKAEDAARKAARALKAEAAKAAKATAAAAAARKAAAAAEATAAAAAQVEKEYSQQQKQQQHESEFESLAAGLKAIATRDSTAVGETGTSSRPNPGKKRGRGGAASAIAGAALGDEGGPELPDLTKGFCKFLAAYTGRDLPLDALLQLLGVAPSLGKEGGVEGDDGEKGVLRAPPQSGALEGKKQKPRAVAAATVKQENSASAAPAVDTATATATATVLPAAAAAAAADPAVVVTPPESVVPTARPTASRRDMLNARRAQKEKEAKEKERIQEEQDRQKAERQREARQRRKKEAARAKAAEDARAKAAAEAAARQQAVEAAAAAALSSVVPPPPPPPPPQQERAREPPQPQPQPQPQNHRKTQKQQQKQEEEVKNNLPKMQHVKSKRAKQAPVQQKQVQSPAKWTGPGLDASGRGRPTTGYLAGVPAPKPSPLNATPGARVTSASGAETQLTEEAASDRVVGHDEMAGVVEEVPMPTGDIDDGLDFFCAPADVGGGGGVGLIIGGGAGDGDGYGMVGAWPQLQGVAIASAVGGASCGASANFPGEKRKKGKGSPRKPEPVVEGVTEPGGTGIGDGDGDENGGGGKESKKKRRRSMRSIRAPIKFGCDEPKVEEVGGAWSSESKRGTSKRPAPASATPAGSAAAVEVGFDSGGATHQTNSVTPVQVSHGQPAEGGDPAAAVGTTSASVAPGAAAANEIASGSTSAAVRAGAGSAGARAVVAGAGQGHQGPPTKRKPSATLNYRRNVRVNRVRPGVILAGVTAVAADGAGADGGEAAATAATAPLYREMQTGAATSDFFAAAAAAADETVTSPEQSISATAKVAKKAMDSLFDTAVLQLSASKQPSKPAAALKTAAAAAAATKIAGGARGKPAKSVSDGAVTKAGAGHVAKPKRKAEVAVAPAPAPVLVIAVEDLLPFGAEVTGAVTAKDIFEAVYSGRWIGGGSGDGGVGGPADEGPWGALTGVLATAHALMEKHLEVSRRAGDSSSALAAGPPDAATKEHLRSLLAAIVATEACAIRHELQAGTEAGETAKPAAAAAVLAGAGVGTETAAAGVSRGGALTGPALAAKAKAAAAKAATGGSRKKRVRFCAFDLSTVDMPTDAVEDSDVAAKEVAQCLARVIASSKLVQKALAKGAASGGGGGGITDVLKLFMRGLKTVAVAAVPGHSSPLAASVKDACRELGSDISSEVVGRAAVFLLKSLESLGGGDEAACRCPLRRRLAGMLSALIRHKLRILLNPPPPKSLSSLHLAADSSGEDGPLKVYDVIQLVPDKAKPGQKKDVFDPTRDGATSAVLSRALRRLHGFTEKGAVEVMSTAEAFVAVAKDKERSGLSDEERAVEARRHCRDTVDILAATRARNFVLELLGFPGVELAVSQARGWGELERLSTELREVKDSPDADASFSLLADVDGLKAWLRQESLWMQDQRAIAVLTKLDAVLVGCDRKEAKRLSQEARRRMWFPRVMEAPEPLQETGNVP